MSSEAFKKLNGGDLDALLSGRVQPPLPHTVKDPASPNFTFQPSTDEKKLNKTEKARLAYLRRIQGDRYLGIQNVTLKLADDCRFTPDFNYIDENGRFVFEDTKGGFIREDALIKIKTAARQFRMFDFVIVKKNGTSWDVDSVKP